MIRRSIGAAVVAAASVVVVPYAIALLTNILYGWPLGAHRYRRAFNPRKVVALNYALLLQLTRVRYAGLFFRWKRFYRKATRDRLIKDLEYGSNGNCLDVYFPSDESSYASLVMGPVSASGLKPIVIFAYGGTWSSGDKNMYGLLCSQLADRLASVVICPNYTNYPRGFVDDMVQDISDAVAFAHKFAADFGADKDCIVLMGHSAGGHLIMMTVVELAMKLLSDKPALLTDETLSESQRIDNLEISIIDGSSTSLLTRSTTPLIMHERHFNGDSNNGTHGLTSSTFVVVDQGGPDSVKTSEQPADAAAVAESFCMIDGDNSVIMAASAADPSQPQESQSEQIGEVPETESVAADTAECEDKKTGDGEETVDEQPATEAVPTAAEPVQIVPSETEELLSSIKLVVGLAGVYDIAAHYIHETSRGIEDISMMARAMYGLKCFDRFSPGVIVRELPKTVRLPAIHLIHGGIDITVPVSASTSFGDVVWKRGNSPVSATIINGCGHTDVCLDLMDPTRSFYDVLFTEIASAFNRHVIATDKQ